MQNELDIVTRLPWWLPYPGAYRHTGHHIWLAHGTAVWQADARSKGIPAASMPCAKRSEVKK